MQWLVGGGLRLLLVSSITLVFSELFSGDRPFDSGDDTANYTNNPLLVSVQPGQWAERLLAILYNEGVIGVWEPISLVVKLVLREVFGLKARTFTGAAVVLHAATCALAAEICLQGYALLTAASSAAACAAEGSSGAGQRSGRKRAAASPERPQGRVAVGWLHALAAALLIGVHPLRVEPLAWASGLPYELAALFAAGAVLCHLRHRSASLHDDPPRARPVGPWRLASAVLLLLACNAKAAALGLAAALPLFDALLLWERRRGPRRAPEGAGGGAAQTGRAGLGARELLRLWARTLAALAVDCSPLLAAAGAAAWPSFRASKGPDPNCRFDFEWWQRWLRACHMAALYLVQQVWPKDLCVLHAVPVEDVALSSWRFGGAGLALAGLAAAAGLRGGARQVFVFVAYLAVLAPTLGIVTDHVTETAADRYCHLASMLLGVPVLAGAFASFVPEPGILSAGGVLAAAAAEAAASRSLVRVWASPSATIARAVQASPRFYRTRYIHGMDLLHSGRVQEAEVHLRASLALCPKFTNSHFGLTQALVNQRRVAEAIEAMRAGAENDPDNFMGHYNLGMMMHQTSRHAEAVVSLERALALMPSDGDVRRAAAASRQALARSGGGGGGPPRAVPAPKPSPPPPPPRPSPAPAGSSGAAAHPAGSSSSGASAGEGRVPYLSVVAASRRDDYGGKLEERVVAHVALMYHQLRERCFWDVELLYVDWNSPPERPGLAELIKDGLARGDSSSPQTSAGTCGWSSDHGPAVRIVTACGELHRALQKEGWVGPAPMPEYFAKNLGIRHARGRFVLATNPDAVLSPSLVSFLARRGLREDTFYSASLRFDDRWPQRPSRPGEYLQRLLARAGDDGRLKGTDYERTIAHRPEAHEDARKAFGGICAGEDDGAASMPGYWDFQAGDFVIAARKHWTDVWAYPEMSWTFGVDSSVLCKFFGRGLRNVALLPPCFVVHQHHRIREIPKGRGEMKEDLLCNLAKQNPRQRFDPRQREPRLWGLHGGGSGGRIGEGAVEVLEIRSGGPPGKAET